MFDVLFAAGGQELVQIKEPKHTLLLWVESLPFKATSSSCNCCRDFYSRTDDDINIVYSLDKLFFLRSTILP